MTSQALQERFGFRDSDFGFILDFGIRYSDLLSFSSGNNHSLRRLRIILI